MEKHIADLLKQFGWFEGRSIDINDDIQKLQNRGYTIPNAFKEIYQEFKGIRIELSVKNNFRLVNFNIDMPIRFDYDDVIIEDYPKLIGCEFVIPIGNIDGTSYLAIDENFNIYSLYDGSVLRIGKAKVAIENLLTKGWREFEELSIPEWW